MLTVIAPHVRIRRHRLVKRNRWRRFSAAKFHQHRVYRNSIQPGGERRVPAKTADRPKNLQERFLSQILRFGHILRHQQAHRVDALLMHLEQSSKGLLVACLRALNKGALGIVPAGLFLSGNLGNHVRNHVRCCRGNYASRHGSLSFDAYCSYKFREHSAFKKRLDKPPRSSYRVGSVIDCKPRCTTITFSDENELFPGGEPRNFFPQTTKTVDFFPAKRGAGGNSRSIAQTDYSKSRGSSRNGLAKP